MTIDISNLSPEKQAFLKVNPELLKSLKKEVSKQAATIQTRQKKLSNGKSKLQRDLEDIDRKVVETRNKADKLRREYMMDANLRRIQRKFLGTQPVVHGDAELVCPVCGSFNGAYTKGKPNKKNGKPWCLKCNSPLVPKDKLMKWRKFSKVKAAGKSLRDEFKVGG